MATQMSVNITVKTARRTRTTDPERPNHPFTMPIDSCSCLDRNGPDPDRPTDSKFYRRITLVVLLMVMFTTSVKSEYIITTLPSYVLSVKSFVTNTIELTSQKIHIFANVIDMSRKTLKNSTKAEILLYACIKNVKYVKNMSYLHKIMNVKKLDNMFGQIAVHYCKCQSKMYTYHRSGYSKDCFGLLIQRLIHVLEVLIRINQLKLFSRAAFLTQLALTFWLAMTRLIPNHNRLTDNVLKQRVIAKTEPIRYNIQKMTLWQHTTIFYTGLQIKNPFFLKNKAQYRYGHVSQKKKKLLQNDTDTKLADTLLLEVKIRHFSILQKITLMIIYRPHKTVKIVITIHFQFKTVKIIGLYRLLYHN